MTVGRAILSGALGRCPNCGRGPLFCGFLKLCARCEACGFDLSTGEAGDGPVVFILLIVGAIGCAGVLVAELAWNWPVWLLLAVFLPLVAALSIGALRPFKGALVAAQLRHRAAEAVTRGR